MAERPEISASRRVLAAAGVDWTPRDTCHVYLLKVAEDLQARLAECEAALRRIENYPFDVNADAVSDLRSLKEIAHAALAAQGSEPGESPSTEVATAVEARPSPGSEQHPEDGK